MESYMDELTLSKKQQLLRWFGVLISIVLFPFMCFGIGVFYSIDFCSDKWKKIKNNV
jgi:hypothetical protein